MKIIYDCVHVKVPIEVRDMVQVVYDKRIEAGVKCRKIDIYMEMAKKVKK